MDGVGAEGYGAAGGEHYVLGGHGQRAFGVGACTGCDGDILRSVARDEFQLLDGNVCSFGGVEHAIQQETVTLYGDTISVLLQLAVAAYAHVDAICGGDAKHGRTLAGLDSLCIEAVGDITAAHAEGGAADASVEHAALNVGHACAIGYKTGIAAFTAIGAADGEIASATSDVHRADSIDDETGCILAAGGDGAIDGQVLNGAVLGIEERGAVAVCCHIERQRMSVAVEGATEGATLSV